LLTVIPIDSTATWGDWAKTATPLSANAATAANLLRHRIFIEIGRCLICFHRHLFTLTQILKAAIENASLPVVMVALRAMGHTVAA